MRFLPHLFMELAPFYLVQNDAAPEAVFYEHAPCYVLSSPRALKLLRTLCHQGQDKHQDDTYEEPHYSVTHLDPSRLGTDGWAATGRSRKQLGATNSLIHRAPGQQPLNPGMPPIPAECIHHLSLRGITKGADSLTNRSQKVHYKLCTTTALV
jgi:hypothetical protein